MKLKKVNLSELVLPDYCNREHPKQQIERFLKEFRIHGQYQPIVTSGNEILCGVLIYLAMKQEGIEKCFINDLGNLSLERKKEIRYLDNQIFDIEDWDEVAIKKFLMNLNVDEFEKFGFTEEEANLFINLEPEEISLGNTWDEQWECDNCGWKGTIDK